MGGDEGIAVLPPLGDVVVENAVRHLIGRHGIHYRSRTRDSEMGYEAEVVYDAAAEDEHERQRERERERQRENIDTESMEIDELESDCISSHTPSRSSSPSPAPEADTAAPEGGLGSGGDVFRSQWGIRLCRECGWGCGVECQRG
jgi:hypothetical protein